MSDYRSYREEKLKFYLKAIDVLREGDPDLALDDLYSDAIKEAIFLRVSPIIKLLIGFIALKKLVPQLLQTMKYTETNWQESQNRMPRMPRMPTMPVMPMV